jgi:DNA-binding response OmpR family regulator
MKRILIVDDEPDMVTILKRVLEINGYEVVTAQTANEAIEKAYKEAVNLILLDVMLPDLTGYEVCRRLKQDKRGLPILLLTARSQEKDFLQGVDAGANGYITKPFDPFRLVERIKKTLEE